MRLAFEWDAAKAASNEAKHGVSFTVAARVFLDPWRIEAQDNRRDYGEPRCGVIGAVGGVLLYVVYTRRGNTHRIISARKANGKERTRYGSPQH